ncbi:hypothetical protein HDZ31DRAFT_50038 [Schizophyllum fasciatum]
MLSTVQAAQEVKKILATVITTDFTSARMLSKTREAFRDLLVDPSSIDATSLTLSHPPIQRAFRAMKILADAFDMYDPGDGSARRANSFGPITDCVRILWPWIAKWLDLFLPTNSGVDAEGSQNTVILRVILVLEACFLRKLHLSDVVAETPWIYTSAFQLWLYLHRYASFDPNKGFTEIKKADSTLSILISGATRRVDVACHCQPGSEVDILAVKGALEAAKYNVCRFYFLAIQTALRLLSYPGPPAHTVDTSVQTLAWLACRGKMPMTEPSRKVARAAVRLLRRILATHQLHGDAVFYAAKLLCTLCLNTSGTDNAMLVWVVRAGALPLLLRVHAVKAVHMAPDFIQFIATQTLCPSILRALARPGCGIPQSLRGADIAGQEVLDASADIIATRTLQLQQMNFRSKLCAYEKCPSMPGGVLRLCPCVQVAYCSVQCQRGHWPAHKLFCANKSMLIGGMR